MKDKIGFIFHLGHGHYTQYINFQDCLPPERKDNVEWMAPDPRNSGDFLANLRFVPGGMQYRRHRHWNLMQAISAQPNWKALFFAGAQLSFAPVVRRIPSYHYLDLSPSLLRELAPWYDHLLMDNLIGSIRERAHQRLHSSFAGFFTMSQWAANGIHKDYNIPLDKIHISLPGANLNKWHFVDRSLRSSKDRVRILMVGGQFRLKGGELLLKWAEETQFKNWEIDIVTWPGELPQWALDCLGNPSDSERVSGSLAPRLPNVRVHCGMKANTPEIMQLFVDADIFCLPTQADGSSIASLEAMATGLPVAVGGVGGIPELITDQQTGFLLKRSDYDSLKCTLDQLIVDRDLRLSIGAAARASCEDFYNVPRQMRDIFRVLDPQQ